jgi:N-acetylglucosamine-6-phosphate deacetylase
LFFWVFLRAATQQMTQVPNAVSVSRPCIDLQINGVAGVDFNANELTLESWNSACQVLDQDGTAAFLPTLITDSVESLARKLKRLAELLEGAPPTGNTRALGIHLEGPFLSPVPGYIGAHPSQHARDADLELLKRWHDLSGGRIRIVTLAPERDSTGACIRWLSGQGILVAAGHTDASRDQHHSSRAIAARSASLHLDR